MASEPDYGWQDKARHAWEQAGRRGIIEAVTGEPMEWETGKDGAEHPKLVKSKIFGKPALGYWILAMGKRGGDPNAEDTQYPKLVGILAPGAEASAVDLGIPG